MNAYKKDICKWCPDPAFITWVLKKHGKLPKYIVFKILNNIGHCYIIMWDKLYKYPVCMPRRKIPKRTDGVSHIARYWERKLRQQYPELYAVSSRKNNK